MTIQLPLPMDLAHQPLRAVQYFAHDGKWANGTDTHYLSLGRAQWDKRDLSVKVLRHTDTRWSRLSEELPIHRAIDLVTFAAFQLHPLHEISQRATSALVREIGVVDTIRFLSQFRPGAGNYVVD